MYYSMMTIVNSVRIGGEQRINLVTRLELFFLFSGIRAVERRK